MIEEANIGVEVDLPPNDPRACWNCEVENNLAVCGKLRQKLVDEGWHRVALANVSIVDVVGSDTKLCEILDRYSCEYLGDLSHDPLLIAPVRHRAMTLSRLPTQLVQILLECNMIDAAQRSGLVGKRHSKKYLCEALSFTGVAITMLIISVNND
jgi:hypothetical protein